MINNRQNGRRRGRNNGPRPEGGPTPNRAPTGGGGGSRIDNRQRGNAHQLHEKYKTLARDSQMQGDRVTAEYYLQYADHYFRVLNEGRVRQEEFRSRQREWDGDGDGEDERVNGRDDGDAGANNYRGDYDQREVVDGNANNRQRYQRTDQPVDQRREAPAQNRPETGRDQSGGNDGYDEAQEAAPHPRGRPPQANGNGEYEQPRDAAPRPRGRPPQVSANNEYDEPREAAPRPRGRPPQASGSGEFEEPREAVPPRPRGRPPRQPRPVESESERFDLVGLPPRASVVPPVAAPETAPEIPSAQPAPSQEGGEEQQAAPPPRRRGRPRKTELTEV